MTRIFSLLLTFTLISLSSFAQDRATLEASRLDILKQIEKTEKNLNRISSKKQQMLQEIARLESNRSKIPEDQNLELVDDNTQRLIDLNTETLAPQPTTEVPLENAAEFEEEGETDFSEVLILQEHMLLNKVRSEQLYPDGYKETDQLLDAMISERHLVQLTKHINERQTAEHDLPQKPIVKEQPQPIIQDPKVVAPRRPTSTVSTSSKKRIEAVFQEVATLTDLESQLRLERNLLDKEQENINLQIDILLRQSSNFGTNETVSVPNNITRKRGFLPWPLAEAGVIKRFGPQNASGSVTTDGITIKSKIKSVTSIYKGSVESIKNADGKQNLVIRHDDRTLSKYIGLVTVQVSEGQSVYQNQQIGTTGGQMEFELWQNNTAQNPLHWLQNN